MSCTVVTERAKSPSDSEASAKRRHDPTVTAVLDLLVEMYPKAFSKYEGRRRPLKVGVHHDLLAALGGAVTADELHKALGCYTSNKVYRGRLREGAARYDLDGAPCGVVTADQAVGDIERKAKRQTNADASRAMKPSHPLRPREPRQFNGKTQGCGARLPISAKPPSAAPPRTSLAGLRAAARTRKGA